MCIMSGPQEDLMGLFMNNPKVAGLMPEPLRFGS